MQSKIFAAAFAALSFSSVQGAVLPGLSISPAYIVTPQINFDPTVLQPQQLAFQTLQNLRNEIAQTSGLVNQVTASTLNLVATQATLNAKNILDKVTTLATTLQSSVPPVPSSPPVNTPDIGAAAENVVREVQTLARAITAQLEALRAQATAATGALTNVAISAAQSTFQAALAVVGQAASLALTTVANSVANVQSLADRVRNAQLKLNPVLVIGAQPDIIF